MNFAIKVIFISISVALFSYYIGIYYPEYQSVNIPFKFGSSLISKFYQLNNENKIEMNLKEKKPIKKPKLFSASELKKYDGSSGSKGIYLAILGRVYNVKKGKAHYGPSGSYSFFTGTDGSRAFVSGDFTETGLTDDVTGLSSQDYIGLQEWNDFYDKDYKFVGKLIGRYYDESGNPTEYNIKVQKWIAEAFEQKDKDDQEKKFFPPCNTEWSRESGSRLWCTNKSGGIERDWVGVPRKLYAPGRQKARCACIKNFGPPSHDPKRTSHKNIGDLDHPKLEEYKDCDPWSYSCQVKLD